MTRRNKTISIFSLGLVCAMIGIIITDLLYKFGNYDTPFLLVFCIYIVYILLHETSSRLTFAIVLVLVTIMSIAYIIAGSMRLTERIGEWFYLFFLFGLLQYSKETWTQKNY